LPTKHLFHPLRGSLICRKILRHFADAFACLPQEVVLRIFIVLKIHLPRPGPNPRTLGPMASTITTRTLEADLSAVILAFLLRLGHPSSIIPSRVSSSIEGTYPQVERRPLALGPSILYAYFISPVRATCSVQIILLGLITLIIL
jgi:hypothetical protein